MIPRRRIARAFVAATAAALSLVASPALGGVGLPHGEGGRAALLEPGWLALLPIALALLALAQLRSLALGGLWSRRRGGVALAARTLLVLLVVAALARPALRIEGAHRCTVALVDLSASMDAAARESQRDFLERLSRSTGARDLRLVTFAAQPRLLPPPGRGPLPALPLPPAPERETTDIAAALSLAPAACDGGDSPRVVLLSDGNQTRGDLRAVAAALAGRLRLDALPIGGSPPDRRVRAIAAPAAAQVSAPFTVDVEVESARADHATIELWRNGTIERRAQVDLPAGRSRQALRMEIAEAGTALLGARIAEAGAPLAAGPPPEPEAATAIVIGGRPRVLYADGDPGPGTPLPRLLRADGLAVDVRAPSSVPADPAGLSAYDLVILSDVEASSLGAERLSALAAFVDAGGGLLFAGGDRVHGAGGYSGSALDRVLPVRFDVERRPADPRLALVLAIDRSASMEGEKLAVAKEAARATATLLGPDDLLGVVAFDAQATPIVHLQPVRNRRAIVEGIARLQAGGGTSFLAPLREAHEQLASARAAVRHVILLTDGEASYEGVADQCEQMAREGITVSAVGVGASADRTLLSMIAGRGGGRFFFADDPQSVPQIFARETKTAAGGSPLVEESTRVHVARPARVLSGVDIASAPRLRGYLASRAKSDADVVLASERGEPILVRRRGGSGGAVTVWTSDVKTRWAADWIVWHGWQRLFVQLARATLREGAGDTGREQGGGAASSRARLEAAVDGDRLVAWADVLGDDDSFSDGLAGQLEVTSVPAGPAQRPLVEAMPQLAPGRYGAAIALDGVNGPRGPWVLRARLRRDGLPVASGLATIARATGEQDRLPVDRALLASAAASTGGRLLGPADALEPPSAARAEIELRSWLLLCAAGLLCVDLLIRRLPSRRAPAPR